MMLKKGAITAIFLTFGFGCVSGTMRMVTIRNELPPDLPGEIRERFEVKEGEVDKTARVPATVALKPVQSVLNKKGKRSRKNPKREISSQVAEPFSYISRRPAKDPIWISEKLIYSIKYFGVSAGDFTFDVLPFKNIDQRKVYHVRGTAISSAVFSLFYRLNDVVETFIDYEGIFSHRFHIVLDETKQERDSLELYDSKKKQTFYWNRWNHKVNGYKEVKEFSPIDPFPQDSVSALFYVRTLKLEPGMVVTFPVVSEGKTFEGVCTVERREMVNTPLGKVQTLVIRPEMKYQGILKKSGESFLWVTDDDRKIPVRLEAKVRIGTVVANLKKAELGNPPAETSSASNSDPNSKI